MHKSNVRSTQRCLSWRKRKSLDTLQLSEAVDLVQKLSFCIRVESAKLPGRTHAIVEACHVQLVALYEVACLDVEGAEELKLLAVHLCAQLVELMFRPLALCTHPLIRAAHHRVLDELNQRQRYLVIRKLVLQQPDVRLCTRNKLLQGELAHGLLHNTRDTGFDLSAAFLAEAGEVFLLVV